MNDIATVVGVDIAKTVFVAAGMNDRGKVLWKKKLARDEVLSFFATLAPAKVGIEACAGAHYWARRLNAQGHDTRLIAAQHVKPFVSGSKNDWNDAQAIQTLRELLEQLDEKEKRQDAYDARILRAANEDERARRLMQVPGIGKLTATAVVAAVSDPRHFPSARDLSANLGLVPRQHSSGGKDRLYGITKRGDGYLRTLLIHCARSAIRCAGEKPDRMLRWALQVQQRRGAKVAAVALANKLARIVWAMLVSGSEYQPMPQRSASAPV